MAYRHFVYLGQAPPSVTGGGNLVWDNVFLLHNHRQRLGDMRRYEEIMELLGYIDKNLEAVRGAYAQARLDEDKVVVARVIVKTILSDLRSALDYSAMSIYESYSSKDWSPHFPYGKDEASFRNSINKNLNGLENQCPRAFQLIRSIQPFVIGDDWLSDLCKITNVTKHRGLGQQLRKNSPNSSVSVDNLIKLGSGAEITIGHLYLDGELRNDKPIELSGATTKRELLDLFGQSAIVNREYDWVEFEFEFNASAGDVLQFLEKSKVNVGKFVQELSCIVDV